MTKRRKATTKDRDKFLRLINKWANRFDELDPEHARLWAGVVELCGCREHKNTYAHTSFGSRSHISHVYLHHVDDIERTALHEQLHIEMGKMADVIYQISGSRLTKEQTDCIYKWYQEYEDEFVRRMTRVLLAMDKEIRSLKRKIKKLEKE